MNSFAVHVKNLTIKFGSFAAVNNITFAVSHGEIFGFLGANGAGKTTTIRALCGLLKPTSGEMFVAGYDVNHQTYQVKSKVGYMSQRFTLYDDLTVDENLKFAASLRKLDDAYATQRRAELFELIEFNQSISTMVRDLPGGIMQQVALVAAVLHDPDIIFLDEPTAGVTPFYRAKFWVLIRKLASQGKTVFVTTHYMDEAEQCGRIALMRSGEIIALNSPAELKRETFKLPLYEITPPAGYKGNWVEEIKKQSWYEEINVHGLRYHLQTKSESPWLDYAQNNLSNFAVERVEPSLEDVFIRLVEGGNR